MVDLLALVSLIFGVFLVKKCKRNLTTKYYKSFIILGIVLILVPSIYIVKEFNRGFVDGFENASINLNQNID
ncbi:hypothetical protein [Clostridium sardiniense]|uniref:hypothetical protein n=1 Tax=Clostridium sardiniense TaxID=29369 RepID=UPI003D33104D